MHRTLAAVLHLYLERAGLEIPAARDLLFASPAVVCSPVEEPVPVAPSEPLPDDDVTGPRTLIAGDAVRLHDPRPSCHSPGPCRARRAPGIGRPRIALELTSRTPDLFDEVIPDGPDGVREAAVRGAAGVLSVMDRELARAAAASQTPLYVVDSLLWMRDEVPAVFREARRYWAQDFLGLRAVSGNYRPAPSIVGPILPSGGFHREPAPAHLLINLGGCESPDGADANAGAYADFVVGGVLKSPLAARFAGRITVIAGTAASTLAGRYADRDIECVSLPHGPRWNGGPRSS
jgi:hypothetical protein